MAKSKNRKPRGRPRKRKNAAAEHVDWDGMREEHTETLMARRVHALIRVLEEIPEKVPVILRALDLCDKRLMLQELLRAFPEDMVALSIGALKMASTGNAAHGFKSRKAVNPSAEAFG